MNKVPEQVVLPITWPIANPIVSNFIRQLAHAVNGYGTVEGGTNTTAGTSATINKAAGRFKLAAAQTTFTLTNSYIDSTDLVFGIPVSNDVTGSLKNVVPGNGSAVFNFVAPAGNMDVAFWVIKS